MFCRQFRDRIYRTVRALAEPSQLKWITEATGLSSEQIIMTKCGFICQALEELLKFRNKRRHPLDQPMSSFYGYMLDLEGITWDGRDTGTDHEMILLYDEDSWWIIDSYLGCRELTCRRVESDDVLEAARTLQVKFDENIWRWLTGCPSTDDPTAKTDRMRVVMTEFNYTRK